MSPCPTRRPARPRRPRCHGWPSKRSRGCPATAWTTTCSRPGRPRDGRTRRKPYRWDIGKEFRQLVRSLGIDDVRIHDLRHTGPSVLLMQGIPGDVVRKITGHRSRELERYQHLSPAFRAQTVDLIAQVLFSATRSDTPVPEDRDKETDNLETVVPEGEFGGVD